MSLCMKLATTKLLQKHTYNMESVTEIKLCSNEASGLLRWFILIWGLIEAIGGILLSSAPPSLPPPPRSFLVVQRLVASLCWKLLTTICQLEEDDQYYCMYTVRRDKLSYWEG